MNKKYSIVLFCNKKRVCVLHKSQKKNIIHEYWNELKTQRKPRFLKTRSGKRNQEVVYELALIFPNTRWSTKTYVKDSLGRLIEAKMEDEKLRIKEIIPYWKEELIYDYQIKKKTIIKMVFLFQVFEHPF